MCFDLDSCFAVSDIDYIKGKPFTVEEIEKQKALEPELNSLVQIDGKRIKLNNSESALKRSMGNIGETYDMRDKSYADDIKVKNQSTTGLCWAFAATTTAEISNLHEQEKNGQEISSVELSPMHFGFFFTIA